MSSRIQINIICLVGELCMARIFLQLSARDAVCRQPIIYMNQGCFKITSSNKIIPFYNYIYFKNANLLIQNL